MPEFLRTAFADAPPSQPFDILLRLTVAAILGYGVALVYGRSRPDADTLSTFPVTLVLLSALIAMVTQVIGDNVARAFSLVGALSIVRFRTVVRDTQDTAFVIFAVVVGMAVGARDLIVAGIGLGVIGAAALIMRPRGEAPTAVEGTDACTLRLRVGLGHDLESLVGSTIDAHLAARRVLSMSTARQGLSLDVSYQGRLRSGDSAEALVKALNRLDGVQDVELRREGMAEERGWR